jgi:hypothetical protein
MEHTDPKQEPEGATFSSPEGYPVVEPAPTEKPSLAAEIKERHPDWPELKFRVSLAPHINPEDKAHLPAEITNSDIWFPESASWSEASLTSYRNLTEHRLSASELAEQLNTQNTHPATIAVRKALYDSGIAVGFIDTPQGSDLSEEGRNLVTGQMSQDLQKALITAPNFSEALKAIDSRAKIFADFERR